MPSTTVEKGGVPEPGSAGWRYPPNHTRSWDEFKRDLRAEKDSGDPARHSRVCCCRDCVPAPGLAPGAAEVKSVATSHSRAWDRDREQVTYIPGFGTLHLPSRDDDGE